LVHHLLKLKNCFNNTIEFGSIESIAMSALKTSLRFIKTAVGGAARRPLRLHRASSTVATSAAITPVVPARSAAISMSAHAAGFPATAALCRADVMEDVQVFYGELDRYNGIHVDLERLLDTSPEEFALRLEGKHFSSISMGQARVH
jgi:hypothetical protein